jgi:hypothetical protein
MFMQHSKRQRRKLSVSYGCVLLQLKQEFCKNYFFKGMKSFVKTISDNMNCKKVHFVGSIAFYLKDELQQTFEKYDLKLGNVLRRPIDGLIAYHIANK